MEIASFLLTTFVLGALCSIPGVIFGYVLGRKGIVRNKPAWVVGGTIATLLLWRLRLPQVPLGCLVVGDSLFVSIGKRRLVHGQAMQFTYDSLGRLLSANKTTNDGYTQASLETKPLARNNLVSGSLTNYHPLTTNHYHLKRFVYVHSPSPSL